MDRQNEVTEMTWTGGDEQGDRVSGSKKLHKAILLSIKPRHAEAILAGRKRIEFRKTWPESATGVILYSSSPVQRIVAFAKVMEVIRGTPDLIWETCGKFGGITEAEFRAYFAGKDSAVGILLGKPLPFYRPIKADVLDLRVAQSHRYLTKAECNRLRDVDKTLSLSELNAGNAEK